MKSPGHDHNMSKLSIKEIGRKLFHLIWLLVLWGYLKYGIFFLTVVFLAVLALDLLRLEFGLYIPGLFKLLRKQESTTLFAPTYTLIGMILALLLFNQQIAIAAILMMVFGDLTAGIIGPFGKLNLKNKKSIEGGIAEFLVNIIVGYFLLSNWAIIIAMAFTATFVERISGKVNDNMLIPIFAGFAGSLF